MVSDRTEFAVGDIEKLFDELDETHTKAKHEKWAKYYDRRRRDVQIKVNDWVLVKTHPLSAAAQKVVAKFKPKFEGSYRVLESQYSRKNGSGERRELEEKGTGLLRRIRVRGTRVLPVIADHLSDHHPALGQNQIEEQKGVERRLWRDETVMPSTSGYTLRPRGGIKVESRPANEKRNSSIQRKQGETTTTVQTLRQGAKNVKQQEYQKQKWATTALPVEERRSEQQQIPLHGGPSRRRQLRDIKIRVADPDVCRSANFLGLIQIPDFSLIAGKEFRNWVLGVKKRRINNVLSLTPDSVTTARLKTYNLLPDIGAHRARDEMSRDSAKTAKSELGRSGNGLSPDQR
ncbi:hypothetical protein TNCV_3536901 [Trichonephila clavipes]|uniref:Uncharacterized protein n=1 Tax=Trichonephila clavipes TaxID=2585209 RepID=A0A8X7B950_TRICX|nr:hypothetical protein TNCV_3536901 [Trichonephila clavipes]